MTQIFQLTHEAGDWSEYNTGGGAGRFDISTNAGLSGTYGVEVDQDAGISSTPAKNFTCSGTSVHRFGFLMALNTVSFASSAEIDYIVKMGPGSSTYEIEIDLIDDGAGNTKLKVWYYIDGGTSGTLTSSALGGGTIQVEIAIQRASSDVAGDGVVTLYINASQDAQDTGIDNYDDFGQWLLGTNTMSYDQTESGTVTGIWYMDNVTFRDDDTAIFSPAATTAFRLLGLAADSGRIYATGLEDSASLFFYDYSLADLSEGASPSSFGAASNTEINSACKGIFPVTRPGYDGYIYLRGRDANDVKTQKFDYDNAATGWTDIGAGSATWDASKMAVGLHPSIFDPDDLIAAFTDGLTYRSRDEGTSWTSQGSPGGTQLTSTRFPVNDNKLMYGGSGVGSVDYSHNYGVSFDAVDITGSGCPVNHIEISL